MSPFVQTVTCVRCRQAPTGTHSLVRSISHAYCRRRYHGAWGVCLPFLGSLFIHFKRDTAGPLLDPLLRKLALLHDTVLTSAPELVKPFESG